jgi:hypothetical protein
MGGLGAGYDKERLAAINVATTVAAIRDIFHGQPHRSWTIGLTPARRYPCWRTPTYSCAAKCHLTGLCSSKPIIALASYIARLVATAKERIGVVVNKSLVYQLTFEKPSCDRYIVPATPLETSPIGTHQRS